MYRTNVRRESVPHGSTRSIRPTARKMVHLGRLGSERGQSTVEYAFVLPILLLLLLGIMEFGILVFNYNTIANAAREGARYGIVHWREGLDEDGIREAALALTAGLDQTALDVTSSMDDEAVQVKVTYEAQLITGMIIEAVGIEMPLTLSAVATMQLE